MPKGTPVTVKPASYPRERWPGIIQRRTSRGFRVRYDCHGVTFTDTFTPNELETV